MTRINRRDVSKLVVGAAAATALGGRVRAEDKPLRVLILGGTGFIGPHFVGALTSRGHTVTLFNRGRRGKEGPPGVEQLVGDRAGQLDALKGRSWDAVIDDSGYTPREVKLTVDLLRGRVPHYIFVSSVAAYADFKIPNISERYRLAMLADPTVEVVDGKTYGGLKAACEHVVQQSYGAHAALVRPTFIVGPGDSTDRFTYWVVRAARGGEMLAPGSASDPVQFIDARDVADFVCICVEQRLSGPYNVCTSPRAVTMGSLLETTRRVSQANTKLTWASAEFLQAQHALDGDFLDSHDIPIWIAPAGESPGAALVSNKRAIGKGLRFRHLDQTIRDTLEWQKQRPAQEQSLRAGLSPEREAALLERLHSG